jgi:hypothetical protein
MGRFMGSETIEAVQAVGSNWWNLRKINQKDKHYEDSILKKGNAIPVIGRGGP